MKVGYIYNIICKDNDIFDSYIGSTSLNPMDRFRVHKYRSAFINNRLYTFINQNGGLDNFIFNIIEKVPYEDVCDLRQREKFYFKLLKPTLNTYTPNRSKKEWIDDNRDSFNEYMRDYYRAKYRLKRELKYYNC